MHVGAWPAFAIVLQAAAEPPALTTGMLVVFGIVLAALVLFVWEPVPIDVTAIAVLVALVALGDWTELTIEEGLSGFSSPATIAVLAMFILSEGIRRTGLVSVIGREIADRYGNSPIKQLGAVLGLAGGTAGFINNTPVVAVMIPMVDELADRTGTSPSKLLMPVSFAAMMGGTLTLIGTSTNLLASDVYAQLGPQYDAFSMFEFTALGVLVLAVGSVYLFLVAPRLIPERVPAREPLTEEFEMTEYLTEVVVRGDSTFVGDTVEGCLAELDVDADIVQLVRTDAAFSEPLARKTIQADDVLVLRTDRESLVTIIEHEGLELAPDARKGDAAPPTVGADAASVDDDALEELVEEALEVEDVTDELLTADDEAVEAVDDQRLVEVVIAPDSRLVGETLESLHFRQRYDASVLAIRRGGEIIHARMDERSLRAGDTLLVQATEETVSRLAIDREFIVAGEFDLPQYREEKLPIALGIVAAVVAIAGLGIASIALSALAGVVAMVVTRCLRPGEVYDAVDWNVVVLLAGLLPLGLAMEQTGAAAFLAGHVVQSAGGLTPILLLGVFYLLTAVLTNVVSNNASVVLLIPVAVDVAVATGADPFAFAIAVTFAASTAFMTPMGYQTNLMVYGPGGYRFMDFVRVGAPLQLLLAVVTVLGIWGIWGV
ncbi:arsenite transport protein [Salinarchaeum sp. Harcht-Bsk1]|uniref:SLC13 family permease n=1 Tax=Salinarchaeum sp. Harcht-Bsk1 TaxID=1333523 RepID=UPI000342371A|nr:SLC13 family permease [Salinarchaeum sp. Harcht-Bsk1]AGN01697.1 arsenite transport protein [Salinarchaeum sp. Harcht-Bsk1]